MTPWRLRRWLALALGVLLTVCSLAALLLSVNPSEVAQALRTSSPVFLLLASASYALSILAKAYRWRLLFCAPGVRWSRLISAILIGQTMNVWMLAYSGELARAYLIGESEGMDKAAVLSTVALERSLDSLTLLWSFVLLSWLMPLPTWLRFPSLFFSGALAAFFLVAWNVARRKEHMKSLFAERIGESVAWRGLGKSLIAVLDGLAVLRRPRVGLRLGLASLTVWAISALTTWLTLQAAGIRSPWYTSFFLLLVFQLGGAVPSAPGRLGVYHYLAVQALAVFGVAQLPALSFAILLHLITFVLMGIGGAYCFWREGYRTIYKGMGR